MEENLGGKTVRLQTVLRLPYYSSHAEDARISTEDLYVRPLPEGGALVYGSCRVTLLFSRTDSKGERFYGVESKDIPMCETVPCPQGASGRLLARFEPELRWQHGGTGSYLWEIAAEGQLSVQQENTERQSTAFGETPGAAEPEGTALGVPAFAEADGTSDGVTVFPLGKLGLNAGQALDLGSAALGRLFSEADAAPAQGRNPGAPSAPKD